MNDLERALVGLGAELDVPEAPDLAPAVLARIELRRPRGRRRWALAVALALVAALVAALAIPEARSALFRVLHIGSERIELVDELPAVGPDPAELDLDVALGQRVSLAGARRDAGFRLRELDEPPDRVYLGSRGTVWFLYGTPERVRLLVAQTQGLAVEQAFLAKVVGPRTRVEAVSVAGVQGFYLSGEPHLVLLLDEGGNLVEESAWLARNVLVWESDGVTYRLEGDVSKSDAVALAESLR